MEKYVRKPIMNTKSKAAFISILSNSLLILIKVIAGLYSGSVSIVSEAIHSFTDLLASLIAYASIKISGKPPDSKYPFGYEKVENISAVIEAILVFLAAIWIVVESVKKIFSGEAINSVGLGFIVMFISSVVNLIVSKYLYNVAQKENSIALEADALHLKADVYSSAGVGLGLLLIWITDFYIMDPILAIIIAILILKEAFEILMRAFYPLLDSSLNDADQESVKTILSKYDHSGIKIRNLRTRSSGKVKFIELDLLCPGDIHLQDAHNLCDEIELEIETKLKNSKVHIHLEPSLELDREPTDRT